jgi:nucleotide-binding universal stress UspA family protein
MRCTIFDYANTAQSGPRRPERPDREVIAGHAGWARRMYDIMVRQKTGKILAEATAAMAFPYGKIMCPVDFTENSLVALDRAAEIARHFGAKLILVHAVPLVAQVGNFPMPASVYAEQEKTAKARLAEIAGQKLGDLGCESIVFIGDVVGGILQAVVQFKPDLLVMATHGRGAVAHFFLGSVAEAVVRKAECPVLTVRNPEPASHSAKG